jgi:hypothetical protein
MKDLIRGWFRLPNLDGARHSRGPRTDFSGWRFISSLTPSRNIPTTTTPLPCTIVLRMWVHVFDFRAQPRRNPAPERHAETTAPVRRDVSKLWQRVQSHRIRTFCTPRPAITSVDVEPRLHGQSRLQRRPGRRSARRTRQRSRSRSVYLPQCIPRRRTLRGMRGCPRSCRTPAR